MPETQELKSLDTHFAFGENWADYSRTIDEGRIQHATDDIGRLLGERVVSRSFLDIGCGSGLHSLAALRRGAARVVATDLDPNSVRTAQTLLERHAPAGVQWEAREVSVFDLDPDVMGRFEVVYSWGVLHHTGAMYEALDRAARMVEPGGWFCVALYRRTLLCPLWLHEKRLYARSSPRTQTLLRTLYGSALRLRLRLGGTDPKVYERDYRASRGMSMEHDIHDWLGGYPYESVAPGPLRRFLEPRGFALEQQWVHPGGLGFFGAGCDEFVFRRV